MIETRLKVTKIVTLLTNEPNDWADPAYLEEVMKSGEGAVVSSIAIELIDHKSRPEL